jgi:hypothetical protein
VFCESFIEAGIDIEGLGQFIYLLTTKSDGDLELIGSTGQTFFSVPPGIYNVTFLSGKRTPQ